MTGVARAVPLNRIREFGRTDTVCIDKSNSQELQEAITSMFSWYQRAAKCYVYLSDVSTKKRKLGDEKS